MTLAGVALEKSTKNATIQIRAPQPVLMSLGDTLVEKVESLGPIRWTKSFGWICAHRELEQVWTQVANAYEFAKIPKQTEQQ